MRLAVVTNEFLKEELLSISPSGDVEWVWLGHVNELTTVQNVDAVIDLLFIYDKDRINLLKKISPKPVIINSVLKTLDETDPLFIRINGWPTFLKREITEAAYSNETNKHAGEKIFTACGRKVKWVPDIAGFLSARIIAMIINEAYFALEEKVSTKKEIDMAMKLGTNYPFGPFEWAEKIGLNNIVNLLHTLSINEERYLPASLLIKEASKK